MSKKTPNLRIIENLADNHLSKKSSALSKKYVKLLFIILSFYLKMKRIEVEANQHIELIEAEANQRLRELVDKQIEMDQSVLDNWQGNAEELWGELKRLERENRELREKVTRLEKELRY